MSDFTPYVKMSPHDETMIFLMNYARRMQRVHLHCAAVPPQGN